MTTPSSRRPLSAIYLGSSSVDTGSSLPSSPHPQSTPVSPTLQKQHPHLPSPPHTNSASSGSTGDGSTTFGSVRIAAAATGSSSSGIMQNGHHDNNNYHHQNNNSRFTTREEDERDDNDEEDHTATLSSGSKDKQHPPPINLDRVKSLADRNRQVLNKLASISAGSRLGTPSPRATRTPLPSATSSRASASSSGNRITFSRSRPEVEVSGSETERAIYSSDHSSTPPASARPIEHHLPDLATAVRERLVSEPPPPHMTATRFPASPARSRRVTMVERDQIDAENTAASRKSPTATRRVRQPLPREFRDRRSLDGASYATSEASNTQSHRSFLPPRQTSIDRTASPGMYVGRGSPSPTSSPSTLAAMARSPRAQRPGRSYTVRESRHAKWPSEDLTADSRTDDSPRLPTRNENRPGSTGQHSPVGNRRVVIEGLRAAGLARRDGDDPFGDLTARRANRLSGGLGTRPDLGGHPQTGGGAGEWDNTEREPRTPASATVNPRFAARSIHTILASNSRPPTSLDRYDDNLRGYRSPYGLADRQPSSAASVRNIASPSATSRILPLTPLMTSSGLPASTEHAKLMLDSLTMFENNLSRLPSASHLGSTVSDLMRSAQVIVQSTHHLNTLIRNGTSHALEEQIEAEVGERGDGRVDALEVWKSVGHDFRESLRMSDELVRTMTGFLLGVGRLLRETAAAGQHGRGVSLDETRLHSLTPEPFSGRDARLDRIGGDGRRSVEGGRRSVEGRATMERRPPPERRSVEERRDARRSLDAPESRRLGNTPEMLRPATSMSVIRDREGRLTSEEMLERERRTSTFARRYAPARQTPTNSPIAPATSSGLPPVTSQQAHGSPSMLVRNTPLPPTSTPDSAHHRRALPQLTIPPPLPTLPSETLIRKSSSAKIATPRKAKGSTVSNATVRGSSIFPSMAPSGATTALTPTTVSTAPSPDKPQYPLPDSPGSPSAPNSNGKAHTFSRARGSTISALSGLQQQQESYQARKRTISATSTTEDEIIRPIFRGHVQSTSVHGPPSDDTEPKTTKLSRASSTGSAIRRSGNLTRPTTASAARASGSIKVTRSGSGSASGSTASSEARRLRNARIRMSLDGFSRDGSEAPDDDDVTPPTSAVSAANLDRRGSSRRRAASELFS